MAEQNFNNIEILLKPFLGLTGQLEGNDVTILVHSGCNTNMLSSAFVMRCLTWINEKLGITEAIILHSRARVKEHMTTSRPKANLTLGGGAFSFNSNWLVEEARYDDILELPWNMDCDPAELYCERKYI